MLYVHADAENYHHAHARNNSTGDEGTVYNSIDQASSDNSGADCYILDSSTDDLWIVVCGKAPTGFGKNELENWFEHVSIKGRINKRNM